MERERKLFYFLKFEVLSENYKIIRDLFEKYNIKNKYKYKKMSVALYFRSGSARHINYFINFFLPT